MMVWLCKRKLVTQGYELRPVQGRAEDTDERVKMPHTEMCEKSEVTSVEEGHDVERVIVPQSDDTADILKQSNDETSADLTSLEKKGLDRKTNREGLMKAETLSWPTRPPPWRDKSRSRGESMFWLASSYWEHEATIQEGVKKYHLCLTILINSLLNVKARSPDKFMNVSDVKVSDEDGYMTLIYTIKANNQNVNVRIWINPVFSKIVSHSLD